MKEFERDINKLINNLNKIKNDKNMSIKDYVETKHLLAYFYEDVDLVIHAMDTKKEFKIYH